jgi:hypothetical protein
MVVASSIHNEKVVAMAAFAVFMMVSERNTVGLHELIAISFCCVYENDDVKKKNAGQQKTSCLSGFSEAAGHRIE